MNTYLICRFYKILFLFFHENIFFLLDLISGEFDIPQLLKVIITSQGFLIVRWAANHKLLCADLEDHST